MTHQQIIKLAAQAESEGNYRFADFLDRELVRVSFNPLGFLSRGTGKASEMALIKGLEQGVAKNAGEAFTEVGIQRAFGEGSEAATGAALRGLETAAPKSGNIFQEAGGMLFGQGNKVISRTLQELTQAEAKITQIITRIAQKGTKDVDLVLEKRLQDTIQFLEEKLKLSGTVVEKQNIKAELGEFQKQLAALPRTSNATQIAQKHLRGEKLTQAEMELLYKEILKTDPTAFAGKSKIRPSDAYDMLLNRKITNVEMNKILSPAAKLIHPNLNFKGSKWGTGLMAAGLGYAALKYGLPLLGAGVAGAGAAGNAALNNMQGGNAGTAVQGGNVEGGSTTYGLGRDNASVGNSQYFANRAPSATVANKKTKWIKTSEL
jgi:hypothetical protein